MFHRVLDRPDPLQPDTPYASIVAMQFQALADHFTVLPLEEAIPRLREGTLPPAAACITFDDGYRDNFDVAWPILKKFRLPATIFVATGFLDGGTMFNDAIAESVRRLETGTHDFSNFGVKETAISDIASRRQLIHSLTQAIKYLEPDRRQQLCDDLQGRLSSPLPTDLMMSSDQVRLLSQNGITIGGHTVHHPILAKVDNATAQQEIIANRDAIRDITDKIPRTFAYPNGKPNRDYTLDHARMVESAGYELAVSTAVAVATPGANRFQLPRFVANERNVAQMVARMWRMRRYRQPEYAN